MMVTAVIGAGFGDEGKGLMTDFFSHREAQEGRECVVVRYNGGAQAGHTVCTPDGERHVFSHLGSGTFAGAATHLSKHFIVNPILFAREWGRLSDSFGLEPCVTIDPRARVTTPVDMVLNQAIERHRADSGASHGSCGVGIWETILRCMNPSLRVNLRHVWLAIAENGWTDRLTNYASMRLMSEIGGDSSYYEWAMDTITQDHFWGEWTSGMSLLRFKARRVFDADLGTDCESIIFEGAQGLMLDKDYGLGGPEHRTPSNTGLTNILSIMDEAGLGGADLFVKYVARWFCTRHGAGPMFGVPDYGVRKLAKADQTNTGNEWQGKLRSQRWDYTTLVDAVRDDLCRGRKHRRVAGDIFPQLAVTWLDACPIEGTASPSEELERISKAAKGCASVAFESYGETRENVKGLSVFA